MARRATDKRLLLGALAAALLAAGGAHAQERQERPQPLGPPPPELGSAVPADRKPPQIERVGFDQKLDARLPLDLALRDERGQEVRLGGFFRQDRPVVLIPVYYGCPMLCGVVLDNIVRSVGAVGLEPGREMEVVIFSFDPDDTAAEARERKDLTFARFPELSGREAWHFLTGDAAAIARLTQAIGFRYERIPETGDFSHTSGIVIATPDGRISRYFFGIDYPGRDVRLALVEAAALKIGSLTDHALLFCFRYDPTTGRYNALTLSVVRLAGVATVIALALALILTLRRDRKRARAPENTSPEKLRTV